MPDPRFTLLAGLLSVSACARAAAPVVGETRTALGTATAVEVAPAGARDFRVIPLGAMAADVEMLFGHPDTVGKPFVMRIRELPGTMVPPHRHPVDEHITVVSGTWYFGTGERFDSTSLQKLEQGAYAFAPAGTSMFAYSPDGAVVQVHGVGPFHIHWLSPARTLDEPGAAATFRLTKGDHVDTPRGPGRIRQGYASGAIVQYEVEGADGSLFMVNEADARKR